MTSRYTNAVLTVIAVCLLVLVLRPLTAPGEAHAQATAPPSARTAVLDVNIASIGGWRLLERAALPVEIESQPVSVETPLPGPRELRLPPDPPSRACNEDGVDPAGSAPSSLAAAAEPATGGAQAFLRAG